MREIEKDILKIKCDRCDKYLASLSKSTFDWDLLRFYNNIVHFNGFDFCKECWEEVKEVLK